MYNINYCIYNAVELNTLSTKCTLYNKLLNKFLIIVSLFVLMGISFSREK